jgi:hypothetical protein
MNYYKVTFTQVDNNTYSIYVKAFNESDAMKIIEDKQLYKKVIDLEGDYTIETISEYEYEHHN